MVYKLARETVLSGVGLKKTVTCKRVSEPSPGILVSRCGLRKTMSPGYYHFFILFGIIHRVVFHQVVYTVWYQFNNFYCYLRINHFLFCSRPLSQNITVRWINIIRTQNQNIMSTVLTFSFCIVCST